MQTVRVHLFARFRDVVGVETLDIEMPLLGTKVRCVRNQLARLYPELAALLTRSQIAVNNEFATDDVLIREGDEIAIIPPVSGGCSRT